MSLMMIVVELVQAVKAFVVPALIAAITARLALGGHRRERWWEKKFEAYSAILLALHRLKRSFGEDFQREELRREPTEEQKDKSLGLYRAGVDDVLKYADIGSFLLSPRACEVIHQYGKEALNSSSQESYLEFLDVATAAADKALASMIAAARADLMRRGF